jgi:signal peptidase I
VGDLILVNKYHYGVRLPIINKKIIDNNNPQRGDVMVFRYPKDNSIDYIKRVVGLPGDEVAFRNQQLYLNGVKVPMVQTPPPGFYDEDMRLYFSEFKEKFGDSEHRILLNVNSQPSYGAEDKINFPFRENCRYSAEGMNCKVPAGHYFMMGDNRDNSQDSRVWGFVPDQNIVGKAFFVWMNFGNLKRIGGFQ